ncbi:MAG: ABC transporter substrate-binding protein [Spirochaetaceae bacterium]|nr:ABC transporter substrate-binding protein [Spirochaetaceae bacterium]
MNSVSKKIVCVLCALIVSGGLFVSAFAAKEKTAAPESINMAVLNGPSGMCFAWLFENVPQVNNTAVSYEVCASPDVLIPKMLKGEIDIGILPPNAAAKIYAKQPDSIVLVAVSGLGMLNLVSTDKSVNSLEDLKGKTVFVAGQGSTPEYVFRAILEKNGFNTGDGKDAIKLDFSIPASEMAAAIASGKIEYAVMPEPFATVAVSKGSCWRALDLQTLWKSSFDKDTFPMTAVVVRKEFAAKYPKTVRAFLKEAEKAVLWTEQNPKDAAALVEKHTLGLKAAIAEKAIPNCAFSYVPSKEARPLIEELLKVFLNYAPESVGGRLPDNPFYFE